MIDEYISRLHSRFWKRVPNTPEDACWEWAGGITGSGYGCISAWGRSHFAHRISWMLRYEVILEPNAVVCHHCDNPRCVNPDHLFCGSQKMNIRDAADKGRISYYRHGILPPLIQKNLDATHCPVGHPYSGDNLYVVKKTGRRQCRACRKEQRKQFDIRRKELAHRTAA